ncbi:MAG: LytR C-terminal domain-containing protein [Gemmatimonas sp.]|nr:LytR C-terminal domain-containing protein [Gemmatimonadaceae bacterium]
MSKRIAAIAVGVVALVAVTAGVVRSRTSGVRSSAKQTPITRRQDATPASSLQEPRWAGGTRITVEVLNATKVRGLARRAALTLRDQGFDVVSTGTNRDPFDSTQVLDRTGHREWALRAARAMGGATVLVRPDSSRDVDLTVLIGASWRPPSQPFYP